MKTNIFICGDIVNKTKNESFIDVQLEKIIDKQDYAICNFEAPVEGEGAIFKKAGPNLAQKKETIEILKKSGFDLLLLANNHMYDYGHEGLIKTMSLAKKHSIETIGAGKNYEEAYKPLIKDLNGLKIAFINASEAQFGVLDETNLYESSGYAWINHSLIDDAVIRLKGKVDKIILFAHAGLEHYEVPLVQWQTRYKVLCDLGVDCIIGSHPHIPQGFEIYNNKLIFYSLGNFYFDTLYFSKLPDYSFSVILKITKEEILFELVFHYKKEGKVRLVSEADVPFKMDKLNSLIHDKNEIEKMYIDAYKNTTKKMFASIYSSYLSNDTFLQIIKKTILKFIHFSKFKVRREFLLQHLNRNETYRWVTTTAIELLNRKQK
tara:strand:- start:7425 stop:8555 length:1131 start_codon:yes stop_codon:yes gene_type:complete